MKRSFLLLLSVLLVASPVIAQETNSAAPGTSETQKAYFAGGCFWCMQYAFDRVKGVSKTVVGYTGGKAAKPDYEEVSSGSTGHAESIEVQYDPKVVTYEQLLETFWHNVDPTTVNRQFADAGTQYRTAIFYRNDAEKKAAEDSKAALEKTGKYDKPIVTQIVAATTFYPAEEYHQEYYKKNSMHFQAYEIGSGRAGYIKRTWGDEDPKKKMNSPADSSHGIATKWLILAIAAVFLGIFVFVVRAQEPAKPAPITTASPMQTTDSTKPSKEELKKKLTAEQYRVTCEEGTEPPFRNAYWNNHKAGIYVDVISGKPLFSSLDKFDSGTGWPSFTKPLEKTNVNEKTDRTLGMERTEVRSASSDAHLGHVFDDGPASAGGMRYCMNSASLRFIPVEDLEKEGFGQYKALFEKK